MHGLEAVAHVRQGAADDDAHRIIEIGPAELVLDGDRGDAPRAGSSGGVVFSLGQGREIAVRIALCTWGLCLAF